MRLEKIIIEDYKSIKHLEWDLNTPLTCLVGQNESGKSNILDVFDFAEITKMLDLNYQKHTRRASDKYTNQEIPNIKFYYNVGNNSFDKFVKEFKPYFSEESQVPTLVFDNIIFETKTS